MIAAPVVKLCGLGMNYGLRPVLRDVEFELAPGCGAAIIGDNGSGKSTLVKILAGLLAPSAGSAWIFGSDSRHLPSEVRRRIGLLSHQSFLYPNLTARENLEFYAALYALAGTGEAANRALSQVGLETVADQRAKTLSRGME
ncbi:MAG: ATP-binding cassette domain-containing protein, partial [Candidatus Binataceae bacterium]